MITILKAYAADPVMIDDIVMSRAVMTLAGLSSDEKPTGIYSGTVIANGSRFLELGGSAYSYDEENEVWIEASGSGSGSGEGTPATQEFVIAAMLSTPMTRHVISDTGDVTITCEWDHKYVIPGTGLESLTINIPTAPADVAAVINVSILSTELHDDGEENMIAPSIILPETVRVIGGFPTAEGDRWLLSIDEDLTATAMVISSPEEQEGGN